MTAQSWSCFSRAQGLRCCLRRGPTPARRGTCTSAEQHGYTASCRRCQRMRDGASGGGVAHIKECRERLERAMRASGINVEFGSCDSKVDYSLKHRSFFYFLAITNV